jgi:hypothetical protein
MACLKILKRKVRQRLMMRRIEPSSFAVFLNEATSTHRYFCSTGRPCPITTESAIFAKGESTTSVTPLMGLSDI